MFRGVVILSYWVHVFVTVDIHCHFFKGDLYLQVISARKGEFETGFERGGQTR